MDIHDFQETMRATYVERDAARGRDDLGEAAARYADGCPRCGQIPCACEPR